MGGIAAWKSIRKAILESLTPGSYYQMGMGPGALQDVERISTQHTRAQALYIHTYIHTSPHMTYEARKALDLPVPYLLPLGFAAPLFCRLNRWLARAACSEQKN